MLDDGGDIKYIKVRVETLNKTYEGVVEQTGCLDVYSWFGLYEQEKEWLYITQKEGHDILVRVSTIVSIQEIGD